jgi:SPP1 family phage portal protein
MVSMANEYDSNKGLGETRTMFGRRVIYSSADDITRDNVLTELGLAMDTHALNSSEIDYLWRYYKGDQPILHRVKTVRPEINNKIVENRANEIVSFKTGYLCGEPIQYVSRHDGEGSEEIQTLNDYMFAEDKASQDQEVVEWGMVAGTAYRIVLPDKDAGDDDEECPFRMKTLDPRYTAVVYRDDLFKTPLFAFTYTTDDEGTNVSLYTEREFYYIENGQIVEERPIATGIPIFEYPANSARLGSFEIVLPLLDALNAVESNRLDGVEQTVQAFLKFINCDITAEDFEALKQLGAIKVKSIEGQKADVDVVKTELDQNQSHTLKEDIYNAILTICGMPNRNGGSSTSDTGTAVLLRDGWSLAESRAKDSEHAFKRAEKQMLRLVLKICRELNGLNLLLRDIDMKFTRRNYENIQSKAQVLMQMLGSDKVDPRLAFVHCGMFSDPESAYKDSMAYYKKQMDEWKIEAVDEAEANEDEESVQEDGRVSEETENGTQA